MLITNFGVTMGDSEVLKPCVLSKSDPNFKKLGKFHTGLDLTASNVLNIYRGRVVYIGNENSGRTVVVQTGSSFCICYKRLVNVYVKLNDIIETKCLVGSVDKYVHLEVYLKDKSDWIVRVGPETWYKADANLALNGGLQSLYDYAFTQEYNFTEVVEVDEVGLSNLLYSDGV